MRKILASAFGLCFVAAPVFADGHASGDAEAGESVFKKCRSCHMIVADDDTVIVKGGKTGPNLYGIYTRQAGSSDGFKYGKSILAAGESGLMWDEANFVEYVADPTKFLRSNLDDQKAKSRMGFKLKDAEDAANVWAYLVSVGPVVEPASESN